MSVPIRIKLLRAEATAPSYAHPGEDAAFDVHSCEDCLLLPSQTHRFMVGIASEIPKGYFVKLETKSGFAAKGLSVLGGVIDPGFRGEWGVMLTNHNETTAITINNGKAIAQAVLHKLPDSRIEIVDELTESNRGGHGFGSGHTTCVPSS